MLQKYWLIAPVRVIKESFTRTEVTYKDLEEFFEDRCFPRERQNAKELLKGIGLDYYDPEAICRKTHGMQFDDFMWMQFSDEPQVKYSDIKIRD